MRAALVAVRFQVFRISSRDFFAGAPVGELGVKEKMLTNKYFVETIIFEFSSSSSMLATTPNGGQQLKRCRLCGCRHN